MKFRTNQSLGANALQSVGTFVKKNRRLLLFSIIILSGVIVGCMTYSVLSEQQRQLFFDILSHTSVPISFPDICMSIMASVFEVALLLVLMFLLGLTPFGVPIIVVLIAVYGFCFGVIECQYYEMGGIQTVLIDVIPHMLISSLAIIVAGTQSISMSWIFSCQLLPFSAHCGGLWQDFKLYLLRYLLCLFLAFAAAVCRVVILMIP